MKKNSGSALTSVVIVFLLVIMIGVPLLGMVMYNYRLREYDSGTKEAEYKNEMIMDKVANIIRREVVAAISEAKEGAQEDIRTISDTLNNSYSEVYNEAYEEADDLMRNGKNIDENDENSEKYYGYDKDGNEVKTQPNINSVTGEIIEAGEDSIVTNTERKIIEDKIREKLGTYEGVNSDSIISILDLGNSEDLSVAIMNEEILQRVCNNIFKAKYQNILQKDNMLFGKIYEEDEYTITNKSFGKTEISRDNETKKIKDDSARIVIGEASNTSNIYDKDNNSANVIFNSFDEFEFNVKTEYKLNSMTPLTYLSATYVIRTPELDTMSSIEQQTVALSNPTLDYAVVAGGGIDVASGKTLKVDGNVWAGGTGIYLNTKSTLSEDFSAGDTHDVKSGRIATCSDIIMEAGSNLKTGTNPIYYKNLYIGKQGEEAQTGDTINVIFNGDVLAKDDLEINFNSGVTINQADNLNYYGYNDKNDEGPDSSSAIVVNSPGNSGITIKLGNLYLAGRAFIDGVRSTNRVDKDYNPYIYKSGESISVKGNYIAYQTPLFDTKDNKYDVDKVKFSPYFIKQNDGKDVSINLVDKFSSTDNIEKSYSDFDTEDKREYFIEYAKNNVINKLKISIQNIKYMVGAGVDKDGAITHEISHINEQASMINKEEEFKKFAMKFIDDDGKSTVGNWLKFSEKEVKTGDLYVFVKKGNHTITLTNNLKGIIICDGNLTIYGGEHSFSGLVVTTGKLTIETDVTFNASKEETVNTIITNYIDRAYVGESGSSKLEIGDLFNLFTYDGSGSTYSIISFDDDSNMININELIGIKDWKKQNYGRL